MHDECITVKMEVMAEPVDVSSSFPLLMESVALATVGCACCDGGETGRSEWMGALCWLSLFVWGLPYSMGG